MIGFKNFEFLIAWRYLKSKRKDGFISIITWLSLIGITLGVATLIIVMSVMNGFRDEMLEKILGMNGHITVVSNFAGDDINDYKSVEKSISKIVPRSCSSNLTITFCDFSSPRSELAR